MLASTYNARHWRLTVVINGNKFVYGQVSPAHCEKFLRYRNIGRAMAFISKFPVISRCPVCRTDYVGPGDICVCGWQYDPKMQSTPNLCAGGPNHAPLSMIRQRWAAGERDIDILGMCPYGNRCRECPVYSLAKETG